jgi:hypothetical protein
LKDIFAMPRFLPAAALAAGLAFTAPAARAEEPTMDTCAGAYGVCEQACAERSDSDSARAGCVARCATARAQCEAEVGYEKAVPWLREQMNKVEDFLRGFRDAPETGEKTYKDL